MSASSRNSPTTTSDRFGKRSDPESQCGTEFAMESRRDVVRQRGDEVEHEVRVLQRISMVQQTYGYTCFWAQRSGAAVNIDEPSLSESKGLWEGGDGRGGIATARIYHAWALERQPHYATTCPHV